MDLDGIDDLVLDGGHFYILEGLTGGEFGAPKHYFTPGRGGADLAFIDYNEDDKPDFVYPSSYDGNYLTFLANSSDTCCTPVLLSEVRIAAVENGLGISWNVICLSDGVLIHRYLPDFPAGWELLTLSPIVMDSGGDGVFVDTTIAPGFSGEVQYNIELLQSGRSTMFGPYCYFVQPPPNRKPSLSIAPNPFNPRGIVKFNVERPGPVELAVYDFRGQKVKDLVRDNRPAGLHEVVWDGTRNDGGKVASGAYILRLVTESSQTATKVTLLR